MLGKINTFDALPMSFPFLLGKQALTLRGLPHFLRRVYSPPQAGGHCRVVVCGKPNRQIRFCLRVLCGPCVSAFRLTLMDATQSDSQRGDTGTAEI